jgi:hypothetical protein
VKKSGRREVIRELPRASGETKIFSPADALPDQGPSVGFAHLVASRHTTSVST